MTKAAWPSIVAVPTIDACWIDDDLIQLRWRPASDEQLWAVELMGTGWSSALCAQVSSLTVGFRVRDAGRCELRVRVAAAARGHGSLGAWSSWESPSAGRTGATAPAARSDREPSPEPASEWRTRHRAVNSEATRSACGNLDAQWNAPRPRTVARAWEVDAEPGPTQVAKPLHHWREEEREEQRLEAEERRVREAREARGARRAARRAAEKRRESEDEVHRLRVEREAAEREAAERELLERAAFERVKAERVAAERAAAEREAFERAAVERVVAERAAAERAAAEQASTMLRSALPPPPATVSQVVPEVLDFALQTARGAGVAAELLQQAELVLNAKRRLDPPLVRVLEQLAASEPALTVETLAADLLEADMLTVRAVTAADPASLGAGGEQLHTAALQAPSSPIRPFLPRLPRLPTPRHTKLVPNRCHPISTLTPPPLPAA